MADNICIYHGRIAHPPHWTFVADGEAITPRPNQGAIVAPSRWSLIEAPDSLELDAACDPSGDPSQASWFLSLPVELQIQIVEAADIDTVLAFRLVSKKCHFMVAKFEHTLSEILMRDHIPEFAAKLHPAPSSGLTLGHVASVWARLHAARSVALRMIRVIVAAEYDNPWPLPGIPVGVFRSEAFQNGPRPSPDLLRFRRSCAMRHLVPRLFVFFHFLETCRKRQLELIRSPLPGMETTPDVDDIEYEVLAGYSNDALKKTHEIVSLFFDMMRDIMTPAEFFKVARASQGGFVWYPRFATKPSTETICALFCVGGATAIRQLWELDGFNRRFCAAQRWHATLTRPEGPIGIQAVFSESILQSSLGGAHGVLDSPVVSSLPPSSMNISPTKTRLSPQETHQLLENMPSLCTLWSVAIDELLEDRGMSKSYYFTTYQAWSAISLPIDNGEPMVWDLQNAEFWNPSPSDYCAEAWFAC